MNEKYDAKRKNVRFDTSPDCLGWLCFDTTLLHEFKPQLPVLVIEESIAGCGVIAHLDEPLTLEEPMIIKIDDSLPVKAKLVMANKVFKDVYHLSFVFDEERHI
ncbi:MAG: hypothetical protein ACO20H_09340 [Bacteriovoracaceae bacterium]